MTTTDTGRLMLRRDIPLALMAGAVGAKMLCKPANAQSSNPLCYSLSPAEIAAGVKPVNYEYPPGHAWRYGAIGDNSTPDDAALSNWLAVVAQGVTGYLPASAAKPPNDIYFVPYGLTISGHCRTRIISDPNARLRTIQTSGYAILITDCTECDFEFGDLICGFSGIKMASTSAGTTDTRLRVTQIQGTGRQETKPLDPMANRVGIYIEGPSVGCANYYHTIQAKYISGFDTSVAFETPAGGSMNSNGNTLLDTHAEGWWFGFYTNCVENQIIGFKACNSSGQDSENLAEAVRIGDGLCAANFNYIQYLADAGGPYVRAVYCLPKSRNNIVIAQDNSDYGALDSGTNTIITHNTWSTHSPVAMNGGIHNCAGLSATSTTCRNLSGSGAFGGSGTRAVTFKIPEPDTAYKVFISGHTSETFWASNKTTNGFTANSNNPSSHAEFDWFIVR